ncbi:hypothetical protein MMC17_000363 [Xylographa soralifera]|nr:hypothetical protein [Xylographa soralifera]
MPHGWSIAYRFTYGSYSSNKVRQVTHAFSNGQQTALLSSNHNSMISRRRLSTNSPSKFRIQLGPIDQVPVLRSYTQYLLFFPLDGKDKSHVLDLLEHASNTLITQVPFLTGQVINENASQSPDNRNTNANIPILGNYIITPAKHPSTNFLSIRHLETTYTSYAALLAAKVPVSMLYSDVLAPMRGLPYIYPDTSPTPVLRIQANFIQGGLILCFSGLHSAIDGMGMGQVVRLFAAACRGEKFSAADTAAMELDRTNIPPPLYSHETAKDHSNMLWEPDIDTTAATVNTTKNTAPALRKKEEEISVCKWTYFRVPISHLHTLKAQVITTSPADIAYITTNDILTALTWRAIMRARSERLSKFTTTSTLMRAVNGRRLLSPKIPDAYFGNLLSTAFHSASIAEVTASHRSEIIDSIDPSFCALVFAVRRSTASIDGAYFRSVAAYLRSLIASERARFTFGISAMRMATGVYVSSWAGMLDGVGAFGEVLGKPECVRRPVFETAEGNVVVMPKCGGEGKGEGWFDVLMGMRQDDLERLRADKESEWGKIAEYIG